MDNSKIDLERVPPDHAKFLSRYATLLNEKKFGKDGFASEFGVIKQHSVDFKKDPLSKTAEGLREENKKKNRYKDILPFDNCRVVLDKVKDEPFSDYINASHIKDINGDKCYIASQGPMPSTVEDFWRLICHFKIKIVVMACREIEMGRHRCQRYWPHSDEQLAINNYMIELIEEKDHSEDLKERKIKVSKDKFKHSITQYHFTSWPDHDAPAGCRPVLHLLDLVRKQQPGDDPPLLIHCSAGCGRTGAIIAVDCARKIIKQKKGELNVFAIVMALRRQRPAMVQTKEQYFFLFQAIYEMICESYPKNQIVNVANPNVPMYANIKIEDPATRTTSPPPLYENLNEFSSYSPKHGRKVAVKPMDNTPTKPQPLKQQPQISNAQPQTTKQDSNIVLPISTNSEHIPIDKDAPNVPPKSPGLNRKAPTQDLPKEQSKDQKVIVSKEQTEPQHEKLRKHLSCDDIMLNPNVAQKPLAAPRKPTRSSVKSESWDAEGVPIATTAAPVYAEVKKGHTISIDDQSKTCIEVWSSNPTKKLPSEKPLLPAKYDNPDTPPSLPERTAESFIIVYDESNPQQNTEPLPIDILSNSKTLESPTDDSLSEKSPVDHSANKQWLSAGVSKLKKFGNLKWTPHKRSSSGTDTIITPPAYDGFKCRLPSRPVGPRDPPSHWPSYPKWPVTRI